MKKTLFVCVACISIVAIKAQESRLSAAPPTPPLVMVAPPAPPIPPTPPLPPVPPIEPDVSIETIQSGFTIINELGYEISVKMVKGIRTVFITKNGKTQKIKLSTWTANRKFYEKKYGHLPPPPPPPVKEVAEEFQFSPPVIKKDSNS